MTYQLLFEQIEKLCIFQHVNIDVCQAVIVESLFNALEVDIVIGGHPVVWRQLSLSKRCSLILLWQLTGTTGSGNQRKL